MTNLSPSAFDTASLSEFAASLSALLPEEIRRTKLLYIENAIDQYHASLEWNNLFRIWVSIIRFAPLTAIFLCFNFVIFAVVGFLFFSVFTGIMFRATKTAEKSYKRSIVRAIETWQDDLDDNYAELIVKLEQKPRKVNVLDLILQR